MNEKDLKDRYAKFHNDWPIFGVSLMCDSWTGPTRMSVINFLIYCNGVTWFHKSIDEGDIIEHLGQLSFYDEKNPVREWMEYGRSNREPVLDEEDEDSDIPIPSQLVRDQIDPKDLQTATGDDCISDWA
jgi:hypothetical protein